MRSPRHDVVKRYRITRLVVRNFRSFERREFEILPGNVVVTGVNGSGKTSVLEAVSLLYPGRGMRTLQYRDAVCRASAGNEWNIDASVSDGTFEDSIRISYSGGDRRVSVNDNIAQRISELYHYLCVLWMDTKMIEEFSYSMSYRRRFFDRMCYTFDDGYLVHVVRYQNAVREINRLLRDGCTDETWISSLESIIALHMTEIIKVRQYVLYGLRESIAGIDSSIRLEAKGQIESIFERDDSSVSRESIASALCANRGVSMKRGHLCFGTHVTKYHILHDDYNINFEQFSFGEKKYTLLKILFAQIKMRIDHGGVYPVVLLDDILDGLDPATQESCLNVINDMQCQTWLSTIQPDRRYEKFHELSL